MIFLRIKEIDFLGMLGIVKLNRMKIKLMIYKIIIILTVKIGIWKIKVGGKIV